MNGEKGNATASFLFYFFVYRNDIVDCPRFYVKSATQIQRILESDTEEQGCTAFIVTSDLIFEEPIKISNHSQVTHQSIRLCKNM